MRELTDDELTAIFDFDKCPMCFQTEPRGFLWGPEAGMAVNIICPNCQARFNIVPQARAMGGQVLRGPGDSIEIPEPKVMVLSGMLPLQIRKPSLRQRVKNFFGGKATA